MDVVLTVHARDALAKREIALAWVEQVLNAPEDTEVDRIDPMLVHYLARIAENGGRVLRVIVNTQADPQRVVTVFFDRREASR